MEDLLKKILVPIKDVQDIRGVALPIGLEYLQLVVTGPPGAGKSYYINQIRGWPNEGYIDLARKGWWKDTTLIYRPREVHLGIPFVGIAESLTVFDREWLDASPPLQFDFSRIKIPPHGDRLFQTNWINRYIFEFLLPDPKIIFERREKRMNDGYFPVDTNLTEEMVIRQVQAYQEIALFLHRAGMNVYIRLGLDGRPMRIAEKGVAAIPRWSITSKLPRPSLKSIDGWKQLFGLHDSKWITIDDTLQKIEGVNIIAHDGRMFEMDLNGHRICFHPEIPLGVKKKKVNKNWIISNPDSCATDQPIGFARLKVGETVIIGRSNKEYDSILNFPKNVGRRHIAVTNKRGDLTLTPLDSEKSVALIRPDDVDYRERVDITHQHSFYTLRNIYGGSIQHRSRSEALQQIRDTNDLLDHEPMRPLTRSGKPGGILELNQDTIPVVIGDLHGQVDNLLKILCENCLLFHLEKKSVTIIILGDAVHSETNDEMEDMESSILMMDLIFTFKLAYPENFFYLRGNHDSFSEDVSKNGISQGVLMREQLFELRGAEYTEEMERFYRNLPYIITSRYFYGCHAAPPRTQASYDQLIHISENPTLIREVTRNRLQRPNYLSGYNKSDIKNFRKALGVPKKTPFIVGHTPLDPFGSVWKNVGGIKNHHIIYSAHLEGPSVLQYINNDMVPLSYPAEPITKLINNL
ncbi:metallophosphoesterase [Desulfopila sp. IMCC35008]|uniref:metallophosphoesterase n=1 Tax=Desulfopila sp. IMCC35008 TaxID=2653858 RepID=UPI0013D09ECC|nr:metallophosphoesterase [Desulfopila sp. IMCC35008]